MGKKDTNKASGDAAERFTEAVQRFYEAAAENASTIQESNTRMTRSFYESSVEALEAQAEFNRYTLQSLAELAYEQQEAFRELSRKSLHAYDGFVGSLFSYYDEVMEEPAEKP